VTERTVPILPSRDLAETLDFWGRLGFESVGEPPETYGYCILRRGDLHLHFYVDPDVDPLTTASSCYAYVDDAQRLHDAWAPLVRPDRASGSRVVAPIDTDYAMREFAVVDRSGNLFRVGSPMPPDDDAVELLRRAHRPLMELAAAADEVVGWTATRLPGWTVRDLLFHLATDCQRLLVALASPAEGPPDTDEVSYWSTWQPGTEGAEAGLRGTRLMASAWSSVRGPADLYVETAEALLRAARRADPASVVRTQNRTLSVASLLHTSAVEAAVHHLDLRPVLGDDPDPLTLRAVRAVLDGLAGRPAPADWPDVRYVLVGTGRAELTDDERTELGDLAERYPLFG
jgi:hypothetical protein